MKHLLTLSILFFSSFTFAVIPESLKKLATIQDRHSEAWMFLAQEAAIDTKNTAERMLDGENSAGALKILEVAIHLMPHRSDLSNLRKKSLETYVSITKKLEEDSLKNCALLQERYTFLKSIAPDALAKLKLERSCAKEEKIVKAETEEDLLKLQEPRIFKELEEEFKADLVKTFPWDDVLANSFMLFRALYGEEFRMICMNEKCSAEKINAENFKEVSLQYCGYVEGLLSVSHGKKPLLCIYDKTKTFKTTPELYQIYEKVFDNGAFDDDIPTYAVLNMTLKYMNKSEGREALVKLNNQEFRSGKDVEFTFKKGKAPSELTTEERQDLHDITFSINYKKTFELYQRNFKASLKKSMPELIESDNL